MDDAYIIGHEAEEARNTMLKCRYSLEALQEQCRHPRDHIVNEERKTYCDKCGKVFWPTSRFWSNLSGFSINRGQSVSSLREKLTEELQKAESRLKRAQSECDHPRREYIWDDGGEIHRCVICFDEMN